MGQTLSAVTRIGATLSSTALTASNCIDNDINSVCSSTTSVDTPWLSVQLPLGATVGYVVFYHRPDCESLGGCSQFATPAQIWVSNALGDHNSATSTACGLASQNFTDGVYNITAPEAGYFGFRCGDPLNGSPLAGCREL